MCLWGNYGRRRGDGYNPLHYGLKSFATLQPVALDFLELHRRNTIGFGSSLVSKDRLRYKTDSNQVGRNDTVPSDDFHDLALR